MVNINDIIKTIDSYYPKDLSFDDTNYAASEQHQNILNLRKSCIENSDLENLFDKELNRIFSSYHVANWTDLDSNNCYEFRILLHPNQPILDDDTDLMNALGGKRTDLFLFISILDKYYYLFINESILDFNTNEWKFNKLIEVPSQLHRNLNELKKFMDINGYLELSDNQVQTVVKDIETECIEKGKVKIFNCLFTELVGI